MRAPTAPSLTTNVIENTEEAQEAVPTLYQAIPQVVFQQDSPAFSPSVLLKEDKWPVLLVRADTANAAPEPTKTNFPDPVAPASIGIEEKNKTKKNQRTVKPRHSVRPPTKTLISHQWQALERVTETWNMSSSQKTHPRAPPTRRT